MRLNLVKRDMCEEKEDGGVPHSVQVLLEVVAPWSNICWIVCADSYFVSITAAELLYKSELQFIGVVKVARRKYPMAYLASTELKNRCDGFGVVKRKETDGECDLLAFVWMDQDCRYFIASGSSMAECAPMSSCGCQYIS